MMRAGARELRIDLRPLSPRVMRLVDETHLVTLERGPVTGEAGQAVPAFPHLSDFARSQLAVMQRAQELAALMASEPAIRCASADITEGVPDLYRAGPLVIAAWIRSFIRYRRESPLEEAVAGPFHVLRTRVGDCDDLATTFSSLVLSIGVEGFVGAVYRRDVEFVTHAIGVCPGALGGPAVLYELSDDRNYHAGPPPPLAETSHSPGVEIYVWNPITRAWWVSSARPSIGR